VAQPLSIENSEWTYLITTRTAGSRLWLIHNRELEERILGCLARYQEIHQAEIFSFIIMGNHYHLIARFPKQNRAQFMRDFNSSVARIVGRYVGEHGRRSVWARRYSYQILPTPEDIKHWFYYVAMNPVHSGLVSHPQDAAAGISREYKWLDWNAYFKRRRHNQTISAEGFTKTYTLRFARLPSIKCSSNDEYRIKLLEELESRVAMVVREKKRSGNFFLGNRLLRAQVVGSKPVVTKTSRRHSFRPIVLSLCHKAKLATLSVYFQTLRAFKMASSNFERHLRDYIIFPIGTYPPPHTSCVR